MRLSRPNGANLVSAGIVLVLGVVALWEGLRFPIGTLARMGAGFFPLVLGVLMIGLAVLIVLEKPRSPAVEAGEEGAGPPWRGILALTAAMVSWPVSAPHIGLVPATFVMIIVASLGNARFRPLEAVINAGVVSALGYFVFLRGFHIPLPAFWW